MPDDIQKAANCGWLKAVPRGRGLPYWRKPSLNPRGGRTGWRCPPRYRPSSDADRLPPRVAALGNRAKRESATRDSSLRWKSPELRRASGADEHVLHSQHGRGRWLRLSSTPSPAVPSSWLSSATAPDSIVGGGAFDRKLSNNSLTSASEPHPRNGGGGGKRSGL